MNLQSTDLRTIGEAAAILTSLVDGPYKEQDFIWALLMDTRLSRLDIWFPWSEQPSARSYCAAASSGVSPPRSFLLKSGRKCAFLIPRGF